MRCRTGNQCSSRRTGVILYFYSVWASYLVFIQSNPVSLREQRVCLDVNNTGLHVAKSLGEVDLQEVLDQVTNIGTKRRRKPHLRPTYTLSSSIFYRGKLTSMKGGLSHERNVRLSVCLSVCPSVKRVNRDKTTETCAHILVQIAKEVQLTLIGGGLKNATGRFSSKIAVQLKKFCYTKFLCVNTVSNKVLRHSLAYISMQRWFAKDVPYYVKISPKLTHPFKNADFQ